MINSMKNKKMISFNWDQHLLNKKYSFITKNIQKKVYSLRAQENRKKLKEQSACNRVTRIALKTTW